MPDDTMDQSASAPSLPTPEFAGSEAQYEKYAQQQTAKQADQGGGGLFGESLGAKVARGMLYMVPVVGQIVDQREHAVVAQKSQINQLILNAALKGKDPQLLQAPEVQKAAKSLFGKGGETFLGVAHHVLSSEIAGHNDWIATMQKHGYGQPGVNPADAMNAAAAEFVANKKAIPKEAQSLITQFAYKPAIGAATQEATRPGKVRTAAEEAQARENVKLNPENVGGEAAAGAYKAGEKTKAVEEAKDPYIQRRMEASIAAHAKSKEAQDDRQNKERDLLYEKHRAEKSGDARVPKAMLDDTVALNKDGVRIDLPPGTTFGQLDQIQSDGGRFQSKNYLQRFQDNFSHTHGIAAPPKGGAAAGTHYDPTQIAKDKALLGF